MLRHRLRSSGSAIFRTVSLKRWGAAATAGDGGGGIFRSMALPNLKRRASNSWSAIQETYLSTKQVFENHRVVFTVGTSIASVLTAWAGYSLRRLHQTNVENRLGSIEEAMKKKSHIEHEEIKKIFNSGNISTSACIATAWTSLVIGYGLGWRGGAWYANRKFQREQLKLMGKLKPHRWQFLRRPFVRLRNARAVNKPAAELPPVANTQASNSQQIQKAC